MDLKNIVLVTSTHAEDVERLKELDERNRNKTYGSVSRSLCVPSKPKVATVLPPGTKVERVPPGRAQGLDKPEMSAKGDRSSNTREPAALSRGEKIKLLTKLAPGLSDSQVMKAKRILGLIK